MSVEEVWAAYLAHHPQAMLSDERRKLIMRRLGEGYSVELLVAAIDGNHVDPHCNGENDRFKQYHSISLILRDADRIERFAELASVARPVDPVESAWRQYQHWVGRHGSVVALDMVGGTYPDEVVAEVYRRVEGDEVGLRREREAG